MMMMKRLSFILLMCCLSCSQSNSNLPEPYSQLKEILPFDEHGWYSNGKSIKTLIQQHDIKVVVEVGCWLGKSTRHIAMNLPRKGKVYAVDHWLGSAEHQPGQSSYCKDLSTLYEQFLSNVIHEKLTDKIIPVRMTSVQAEKYLSNIAVDLIYIDASHDFESVYQDVTIWFPHVKGHGILCGDDWNFPDVHRAVEKFALENHLKIESRGNFWRLI